MVVGEKVENTRLGVDVLDQNTQVLDDLNFNLQQGSGERG